MPQATPTVARIRALYPDPKPAIGPHDNCYCVGGALSLYLDPNGQRYPSRILLAEILHKTNPQLDEQRAWYYAGRIIGFNDGHYFEHAWEELDAALTYEAEA